MLFTKCILAPADESDGHRISMMSRHTLNDGITPDSRIALDGIEWRPVFAPPSRLLGDYYKRGLAWEDFERRYLAYLVEIGEEVMRLVEESRTRDVTILCIEETCDFCHRRLLAEQVRSLRGDVAAVLR